MIRKPGEMKSETRANMRGGDGEVTIRHYFTRDEMTAHSRLCAELIIPPGASIGRHDHETEDEVYIITAGSGVLDDGQTESRVATGDAILTGNGSAHAIRNDGDTELRMIAVIMCYS